MATALEEIALECLELMLRPLARFCLKFSLGVPALEECAKRIFLEVASEEMQKKGEKVNISKLSAVTGIQRRAAVRIYREGDVKREPTRAARVIGTWRQDSSYLGKSGKPRILSLEGEDCEFNELVRKVSRELHPRAVLYDLERVGAIEITPSGAKLTTKSYKPKGNPREAYKLLGEDTEDLIEAVSNNVAANDIDLPNYHAKTQFDNIDEADLPAIRSWFFKQCSSLQKRAEKMLSKYDLDLNRSRKGKGGKRVALGIFTRT